MARTAPTVVTSHGSNGVRRPPTSEGAGKHAWCWLKLERKWTETVLDTAWYKAQGRDAYNAAKIDYEHAKELEREP